LLSYGIDVTIAASRPSPHPAGESWPLAKRVAFDFIRPYWRAVLVVLLCTVLIAITSALYPIVIKWTFDGLEKRDAQILSLAPFAVIIATLLKGLAVFAQVIATNRAITRMEVAMQVRLFDHLIDADMLAVARDSSGDLVQRFNGDVARVRDAISRLVTVVFRDVATAIGVIAWMFYIDWRLSLVLIAVLPLVVWPIIFVGQKIRRISRSIAEASGQNTSAIIEAIEAPRIAKLFQLETYLKGRAAERFNEIRRFTLRATNYRSVVHPIMELAGGVAVAGVLFIIGWRIIAGADTSTGDFIGFVSALLVAAQPITSLGNFHVLVQEALAGVERYYALIDRQPTVIDRPGAAPLAIGNGTIAFKGTTFGYTQDQPAIANLDLVMEGGRITALVGRSGSGKTTIFGLLGRLFDPESGAIMIDGQDLRAVTLASLRASMAVVSQDAVLYDDTVERNIGFGRAGATREEIEAAAKAAAAHDFILALPDGYATTVGTRGEKLSGGQRQRVAIARAFLRNAPILCLDEATSALDSESEAVVQEALQRLMKGRTVIMIAHRLATIRNADAIVVLDAGRVAEMGTHEELITAGGLYEKLYTLQFGEEGARA
jgi:ATP-binding cassette, subfamily B, bacterial MsbA